MYIYIYILRKKMAKLKKKMGAAGEKIRHPPSPTKIQNSVGGGGVK